MDSISISQKKYRDKNRDKYNEYMRVYLSNRQKEKTRLKKEQEHYDWFKNIYGEQIFDILEILKKK